jgi:rSAM/selenodomain-associated transferase 1
MPRSALLIFAKEPAPGRVKTRMTPPWSAQQAAALSECFIRDTLLAAAAVDGVDRYLFISPPGSEPFFRELCHGCCEMVVQQGSDFTQRCVHSLRVAANHGYEQIVQIGTDTPQIRAADIQHALDALTSHDMVFGPTRDGGYYLLALSRLDPGLYDGVVMGRETVYDRMMANAQRRSWRVRKLSRWIDADTDEDLRALREDPNILLGTHTRAFLNTGNPKG